MANPYNAAGKAMAKAIAGPLNQIREELAEMRANAAETNQAVANCGNAITNFATAMQTSLQAQPVAFAKAAAAHNPSVSAAQFDAFRQERANGFNNNRNANGPANSQHTTAENRLKHFDIPSFNKRQDYASWQWAVKNILRQIGLDERVDLWVAGNGVNAEPWQGSDQNTLNRLAALLMGKMKGEPQRICMSRDIRDLIVLLKAIESWADPTKSAHERAALVREFYSVGYDPKTTSIDDHCSRKLYVGSLLTGLVTPDNREEVVKSLVVNSLPVQYALIATEINAHPGRFATLEAVTSRIKEYERILASATPKDSNMKVSVNLMTGAVDAEDDDSKETERSGKRRERSADDVEINYASHEPYGGGRKKGDKGKKGQGKTWGLQCYNCCGWGHRARDCTSEKNGGSGSGKGDRRKKREEDKDEEDKDEEDDASEKEEQWW